MEDAKEVSQEPSGVQVDEVVAKMEDKKEEETEVKASEGDDGCKMEDAKEEAKQEAIAKERQAGGEKDGLKMEDTVNETAAAAAAAVVAPSKKLWSDEDFGDFDLSAMKVTDPDEIVDKPEHIKSKEVVEPEIIKKMKEAVGEDEQENTGDIFAELYSMVAADDTPYTSAKSFEDLNLSPELLQGLYVEMKFEKPSKIQAETLPMIVSPPYQNLIAQAQNGSGKTTCFVLGMLSRVDPKLKVPQALCVCPTRELVIQNEEVVTRMGKFTGITSACTATAESPSHQFSSSRREKIVDQLIIGTPGTLKRWVTSKVLDTKNIKILVFDEADQMLDQDGFQDDSLRILKDISKSRGNCQVLLFSATFSEKVKAFAMRTVPRANHIFVGEKDLSLDKIQQYQIHCPDVRSKIDVLKDRIFPAAEKLGQSIIFVRTRGSASELHKRLEADGYKCTSIQGGLTHEERDRVIKEFRAGVTKILIATDVLARGFDLAQVTMVVNFDLPVKHVPDRHMPTVPDYETYLHRIGRSGRFGLKGAAFNLLVTEEDKKNLQRIEKHFNKLISEVAWDDDNGIERVLQEAGLA